MKVIYARNVNHALQEGLRHLQRQGYEEDSRAGPVLVSPVPVVTIYTQPAERVLFSRLRDANPFFHLMEAIWMIAGRNDVAFVSQFASRLGEFSDDGVTLNGSAYGARWRNWFGYDQLKVIVKELKDNPHSRRCVLAMWDAYAHGVRNDYPGDLNVAVGAPLPVPQRTDILLHQEKPTWSKDVPCNTHVYFRVMQGCLDITVCNRSNDAVWGAYGANAVHFSFMHEVVARATGLTVGNYYQMSNNFHIYRDRPDVTRLLDGAYQVEDLYASGRARTRPLFLTPTDFEAFLNGAGQFCIDPYGDLPHGTPSFFTHVAQPMARAHKAYKAGDFFSALEYLGQCEATDWRQAGAIWLRNRNNWKEPRT